MSALRVVGELPSAVVSRLVVDRLATLEQVLAWCHAHGGDVIEVIVQDEYTHDVIVRGPAGPELAYLCFDTT